MWFLLGIYAERSGDLERAQAEYGRAMQADPADYRPDPEPRQRALHRGGLRRGDPRLHGGREAGARRPPRRYYNLSLARGEAYDFDGQALGDRARPASCSTSRVAGWAGNPTLSRVVPAGYPLSRARARIADWNAQPKSRRLPGHGTRGHALARPDVALGAGAARRCCSSASCSRAAAGGGAWPRSCERCGRAFCNRCRRYGDPALYCAMCSRSFLRKENVDIEAAGRRGAADAAAASGAGRARAGSRRCCCRARTRSSKTGPSRARSRSFSSSSAWPRRSSTSRLFDPLTLPPASGLRATVDPRRRARGRRLAARAAGRKEGPQWVLKAPSRSSR